MSFMQSIINKSNHKKIFTVNDSKVTSKNKLCPAEMQNASGVSGNLMKFHCYDQKGASVTKKDIYNPPSTDAQKFRTNISIVRKSL